MYDVSDEDTNDFRPSQHVKTVWCLTDMYATSRVFQTRRIWRTIRQVTRMSCVSVRMSWGCYEKSAPVDFRLNGG